MKHGLWLREGERGPRSTERLRGQRCKTRWCDAGIIMGSSCLVGCVKWRSTGGTR